MWLLLALACTPPTVRGPPRATVTTPTVPTPVPTETTPTATPCEDGPGSACDPFPIDTFPYVDDVDTSTSPNDEVDAYACAPDLDESGPEWWYAVTLTERGVLTASLDGADPDVDVDVHLLGSTDPEDCIDRDHLLVSALLDPGTYLLVLDTWVDDGVALAGADTLTVTFAPIPTGACATVPTDVRMFWTACDGSIAGCSGSGSDVVLATPAIGPVVKEAHLVTVDDAFGGGWPSSFYDQISAHYALSEAATGYAMDRGEPWAPAGEGGSEYGQGSTGAPLPVEDEAWYVNMYWRDRPAGGTRLIVRNVATGRAVVTSAGWETGPGANTAIGGTTEEVHDWLETSHLDDLEFGFAADPTLPLGPIVCD